jgi:hypothetical protein
MKETINMTIFQWMLVLLFASFCIVSVLSFLLSNPAKGTSENARRCVTDMIDDKQVTIWYDDVKPVHVSVDGKSYGMDAAYMYHTILIQQRKQEREIEHD